MSAPMILRARLSDDGRVELIDPLPAEIEAGQEFLITVQPVSLNAVGEPVIVDEVNGIEWPLHALTLDDLAEIAGLWADRRDEIPDAAAYVRQMRRSSLRKTPPWPDQR